VLSYAELPERPEKDVECCIWVLFVWSLKTLWPVVFATCCAHKHDKNVLRKWL
jgi:hypothetical protein